MPCIKNILLFHDDAAWHLVVKSLQSTMIYYGLDDLGSIPI